MVLTMTALIVDVNAFLILKGMLGNRYGFVPSEYVADSLPKYDWLQTYPSNRSITELEFIYGALEAQRLSGRMV